jgi:hypothetical protein
MSRESLVVFAGITVVSLPYLGIPEMWKLYVMIGLGSILTIVGYSLRRTAYQRRLERINNERGSDSFMEHDGRNQSLFDTPTS